MKSTGSIGKKSREQDANPDKDCNSLDEDCVLDEKLLVSVVGNDRQSTHEISTAYQGFLMDLGISGISTDILAQAKLRLESHLSAPQWRAHTARPFRISSVTVSTSQNSRHT